MNSRETLSSTDLVFWLIDDDIPVDLFPGEKERLLSGELPIDRGTLSTLLQAEGWADAAVKNLTEKLVAEAKNVVGFQNPSHAIEYINSGGLIPDCIVFDLGYRVQKNDQTLEQLKTIVETCVTVLQIYTNESEAEATKQLESLPGHILDKIEKPKTKPDTGTEILVSAVEQRVNNSISAVFAPDLRRLTSLAVEHVLSAIDNLPISAAVKLLAGEHEFPKQQEFIEFISVKVEEQLTQNRKFDRDIRKFGIKELGIEENRVGELVSKVGILIQAQVRQSLLQNDEFRKNIIAALSTENITSDRSEGVHEDTIRHFEAFRLYSKPSDDYVRTGDIVETPGSLQIILTPACDLERFWRNARGTLTSVSIHSIADGNVVARAKGYGNQRGFLGEFFTITNKHPFILPSVPLQENQHGDYLVYAYEINTIECEHQEHFAKTSNQLKTVGPLSYADLSGYTRICKISEPYLSGLLDAIRTKLFRLGVPNLADTEQARLISLFVDP